MGVVGDSQQQHLLCASNRHRERPRRGLHAHRLVLAGAFMRACACVARSSCLRSREISRVACPRVVGGGPGRAGGADARGSGAAGGSADRAYWRRLLLFAELRDVGLVARAVGRETKQELLLSGDVTHAMTPGARLARTRREHGSAHRRPSAAWSLRSYTPVSLPFCRRFGKLVVPARGQAYPCRGTMVRKGSPVRVRKRAWPTCRARGLQDHRHGRDRAGERGVATAAARGSARCAAATGCRPRRSRLPSSGSCPARVAAGPRAR